MICILLLSSEFFLQIQLQGELSKLSEKMDRVLNVIHPARSILETDACEDCEQGQGKDSDCINVKDYSSIATISQNPDKAQVLEPTEVDAPTIGSFKHGSKQQSLKREQQPSQHSISGFLGWVSCLESGR